jgi:hypothetical protein
MYLPLEDWEEDWQLSSVDSVDMVDKLSESTDPETNMIVDDLGTELDKSLTPTMSEEAQIASNALYGPDFEVGVEQDESFEGFVHEPNILQHCQRLKDVNISNVPITLLQSGTQPCEPNESNLVHQTRPKGPVEDYPNVQKKTIECANPKK